MSIFIQTVNLFPEGKRNGTSLGLYYRADRPPVNAVIR